MLQALKTQLGDSIKSVGKLLRAPIKIDEGGHVKLAPVADSARNEAREERRKRVLLMRRDLYELLSQHPASRRTLRYIAAVERALQARGLAGLEALPARVVAKALTEMEILVLDWSPAGLAELRSRLAVIVKTHRATHQGAVDEAKAGPASMQGSAPDVMEVDHAEFEEMERSWVGFVPQESPLRPGA